MKHGKVAAVLTVTALSTALLTAPAGAASSLTGRDAEVSTPSSAVAATSRYEAESAPAVCSGAVASNHSGYSGSGFCDTSNAVGSAVTFTVNAAAAGTATLAFRYANGSGANRPGDVSVNGSVAQAGMAFAATASWTTWATRTLTVQLNAGANTVRLAATTAGGLGNIDYLEVTTGDVGNDTIMRGADVSTLQRAGDLGTKYYYANGTQGDALDILKSAGVNYVRLRIWNNPRSGYNNKAKVLEYARTVKAKGLKLMIDFHYSDTWADPGKQYKPAAWANHGIGQLQTDVYNYTYDVCNSLKAQGTTPDSVQIGNEINTGMLWPEGAVNNSNFTNLGLLLKAGYNATKACNSGTQVVIHTARVESGARWFYDGIRSQGVQWDVTALSYYCYWHGSMSGMAGVVSDMKSRYGKPVILAETAYPFTTANYDHAGNIITSSQPCAGHSATPSGQQANFAAVQNTSRNAGASGVFYWEPTWHAAVPGNGWDPADINNSGNAWENQAVFDRTGRINPNIRWLP
ncbi:glycosyl hydrolase 53 family protein [Kribbella sp. NBC_01245]|uniref:glycosyl hydrolase 53 family protein n=1 Tax=Kribbella sp. NBC_01245 TaxID=2903578 RepID=UPI002E2C9332|nr:glycosyl hydrolase 53 family protein [Kribbella sp. NBC_01245]